MRRLVGKFTKAGRERDAAKQRLGATLSPKKKLRSKKDIVKGGVVVDVPLGAWTREGEPSFLLGWRLAGV